MNNNIQAKTQVEKKTKPLDKQFIVLQAIAIILVVMGHKNGNCVTLLKLWFPYYSFHMPLFIFISGYFYSSKYETDIKSFIKRKVKRLIVPYFIWNLIYGIIFSILYYTGIFIGGDTAQPLSLYSFFVLPFIDGGQYCFNLATWFVLSLFLVQIFYIFVRKLIKIIHLYNEYVLLFLAFAIGVCGLSFVNLGLGHNEYFKPLIRLMFFFPFFHFGYFYKEKLKRHDNLNSLTYFVLLFIIQFILIQIFDVNNLNFDSKNITFRGHNILPIITSLTGIALWLRVARIISFFGDNKYIIYIGQHTWDIMTHHIFVFFILNSIFAILVSNGIDTGNFDWYKYRTQPMWHYSPFNFSNHFYLLPCFLGVIIPLYFRSLLDKTSLKKILR